MHKEAGISRDRATAVYRHNRTRSLKIYDQRTPLFIPLHSIFLRRPLGTPPAPVDAMVLSGCRTCSSLTNETIHLEGGTRRRGKRNKESKGGESKANCRGTRYGPRDLPSLPQS